MSENGNPERERSRAEIADALDVLYADTQDAVAAREAAALLRQTCAGCNAYGVPHMTRSGYCATFGAYLEPEGFCHLWAPKAAQ